MLPPPAPVVVVQEDVGGSVVDYAARVSTYLKRRVTVRIEGDCASACTMLAALPRDRLCVGPDADFRFHQAFHARDPDFVDTTDRSEAGTATLMRHYPAALRAWIDRNGGLGPDLITLQGAELRALFPTCPGSREPAPVMTDRSATDVLASGRLEHSSR